MKDCAERKGGTVAVDQKLGPIGTRVLHEDKRVRVWEVELEPGQEHPLHEHTVPYVVVVLEGTRNRLTSIDGEVMEADERAGDVLLLEPAIHKIQNVGE